MGDEVDAEELAAALFVSLRQLVANARKSRAVGDLSAAETSALVSLKRAGVTTSAALARVEQITPQAMGATLAALESRGLIERGPDPDDGRRILLSLTGAGLDVMVARRTERTSAVARTMDERFSPAELRILRDAAPLLERLAEDF